MKSYGEILEGTFEFNKMDVVEERDKLYRLLINLCSSIDREAMDDETYAWYLKERLKK